MCSLGKLVARPSAILLIRLLLSSRQPRRFSCRVTQLHHRANTAGTRKSARRTAGTAQERYVNGSTRGKLSNFLISLSERSIVSNWSRVAPRFSIAGALIPRRSSSLSLMQFTYLVHVPSR